jgi:hypothetical protein
MKNCLREAITELVVEYLEHQRQKDEPVEVPAIAHEMAQSIVDMIMEQEERHQASLLDRFDPTVGKRHEGASGDQGLHHVFVIVIEIVRSELGSSGIRTDSSAYHGTPLQSCAVARQRSSDQPCRGDEMLRARFGLIQRTGAGQVIRHREVGRQETASSPEGPGYNLLRQTHLVAARHQTR